MDNAVFPIEEPATWAKIRDQLATHNTWFPYFDTTLDEKIKAALSELDLTPLKYQPDNFDWLLTESGRLLERCLSYRREYMNREAEAVDSALTVAKYTSLNALQGEFSREKYAHLSDSLNLVLDHLNASLNEFAEGVEDPIAAGFKCQTDAEKAALLTDIESFANADANDRSVLLSEQQFYDALSARESEQGSALNHKERAERAFGLLVSDLMVAYEMCYASSFYLNSRLSIQDPVPLKSSIKLLDELVTWSRMVTRKLELALCDESNQVLSFKVDVPDAVFAIPGAEWSNLLTRVEVIPELQSCRIVSATLRYVRGDAPTGHGPFPPTARAILKAPPQILTGLAPYRPPSLYVGTVFQYRGTELPIFDRGCVLCNCSPFGDWEIKLSNFGTMGPLVKPKSVILYLEVAALVKRQIQ